MSVELSTFHEKKKIKDMRRNGFPYRAIIRLCAFVVILWMCGFVEGKKLEPLILKRYFLNYI